MRLNKSVRQFTDLTQVVNSVSSKTADNTQQQFDTNQVSSSAQKFEQYFTPSFDLHCPNVKLLVKITSKLFFLKLISDS